jgi:anti-sigma B factor antagonist
MSITRTDSSDNTTVLKIDGVLDAVTAPEVRPIVEAVIADQRRDVTVDVSNLRLIDSSGVGVIVSLFKRAKSYGGEVKVSGLKDQPLTIFKLLRLDRVFGIS